MNRIIQYLAIVLLSLGFFMPQQDLTATHIMGSDVTYECVPGQPGKFKLILKAYRDCRGISIGTTDIISIKACSYSTTITANEVAVNNINKVCAGGTPPCIPQNTGGSAKGIEEHVYEATIDLNVAPYSTWIANGCCKFVFSWTSCCRNGAITTGIGGSFYSDAMLDVCAMRASPDSWCNNTPRLTTPPIGFGCCNSRYTYNNGASDNVDFDSIGYSLVYALGSGPTDYLYPTAPLDVNNPMTAYCPINFPVPCDAIPEADPSIGFFIDTLTGDIIFNPTDCSEVGVLAIEMREFRKDTNGVRRLVGTTRRDIQIEIEACGQNNAPTLGPKFAYSVCEGEELCFDIVSKDLPVINPPAAPQVPDTTFLSWNKGIPGGTFKTKDLKVRERVGQFCWKPALGQASTLPYTFTVTVEDQFCPRPAVSIRGFAVTVNKRALADRKYDTLPCGKLIFEAIPELTFLGIPKYLWAVKDITQTQIYKVSSSQKDSFRFRRGGTYIMELLVDNQQICPTLYLDTVIIPPFIVVELAVADTFVCQYDTLKLTPRIGYGKRPIIYKWTIAGTGELISTDSILSYLLTQDTTIAIHVTDANTCTNTDSVFVHFQKIPTPNLGPDQRICTYDSVRLKVPNDSNLLYSWNNSSLTKYDTTRLLNVAGKYWVHEVDTLGCIGKDTFQLFVNDTVVANAGPDTAICFGYLHTIKGMRPNDPSFAHSWNWYNLTTSNLVGSTQNIKVSPPDSTKYRLHLRIIQAGLTCENSDTMFLRVNQLPDLSSVSDPTRKCFDFGQFDLLAAYPVGNGFAWSEKGNSDIDFTMVDKCRDTMVRKGLAAPHWYYTQRFFNPNFSTCVPTGQGAFDKVMMHVKHRPTGCVDSTQFKVVINPNPVVKVQNRTLCQDGGSIKANSNLLKPTKSELAGGIYTWTIDSTPPNVTAADKSYLLQNNGSVFSPDYVFNPKFDALPTDDLQNVKLRGKYKLRFCYTDGYSSCSTCDSMYIEISDFPKINFTPFPKICYSDSIIKLDDYVNLDQGRWVLIRFGPSYPGEIDYERVVAKMIDSTAININYEPGEYYWRYVNVRTGCPVSDSVIMIVNKEPVVVLTEFDTLCLGAATIDLLPQSSPQATAGAAGSAWSGPGVTGNVFDPNSIITPTATEPFYGPYFLKNYYIDPLTTCTTIDSIDVVMQAPPTLTITTPLPAEACEGEDFQLDVIAERTYSGIKWKTIGDGVFNDSSIINPIYTPGVNDQLIYGTSLSVTSNWPALLRNCPAATANIDLAIHAYPVFTYGNRDSGCAPITVDFFDTVTRPTNYPVSYLWDFGNGITSTDEDPTGIVFDKEGYYNVILTVTNTAGLGKCSTTDTMQLVDVYPVPVASFISNPDYYTTVALPRFDFTSTSTVTTGKIVDYHWDFGNGFTDTVANTIHRYGEDTAEYIVTHTVITDKGCIDDTSKTIKIGPDITVFIPSAFSPDGAGPGRNNKFFVVAGGYIGYNLKIYNRWGEMLFESHDPEKEPWDGTYQNQPVQQDVYMYVAKVISFDNQEYSYSGTVTLLR